MQATGTFRRRYSQLTAFVFNKNHDNNNILLSGAIAVIRSDLKLTTNATFPYLLDDVGCSGSETNLLYCPPQHNCRLSVEDAGVQCLRKGIFMQYFVSLSKSA